MSEQARSVNDPQFNPTAQPGSVSHAVETRRSIRAFTDKVVPLQTLKRIMDQARWSPSGCNLQPWQATILTGEPLHQLQTKLKTAAPQVPVEYDIVPPNLPADYTERLREMGAYMYGAQGIARADEEARRLFAEQNLMSFGAPVLLLCHIDRSMGLPQWSDVGMWLQTIMLLLREAGLDSCPQEYMALYARLIKEQIGVDDDKNILFCGMAIGYRQEQAALNIFSRPRAPLESQVRFEGF
jgi:nitroreductase